MNRVIGMKTFQSEHRPKVLIMAQGQQRRLQHHIDCPKHFVELRGLPLIERTMTQLISHGIKDISIIAPRSSLWLQLSKTFSVKIKPLRAPGLGLLDGIYQTSPMWAKRGRTVILLGDVVFSNNALKSILSDKGLIRFFGRLGPNRVTGCPYGELFGFSFFPSAHKPISDLLNDRLFRRQQVNPGHFGQLWALYYRLLESPCKSLLKSIEDFTDDIDTPSDLMSIPRLLEAIIRDESPTSYRMACAEWMTIKDV